MLVNQRECPNQNTHSLSDIIMIQYIKTSHKTGRISLEFEVPTSVVIITTALTPNFYQYGTNEYFAITFQTYVTN
jgi:hypothetical protein